MDASPNASSPTKAAISGISRRQLVLSAGAGLAAVRSLSAQDAMFTARQVVERIQKNVGIPWREQTVDNFKDGSNPDRPLTGIATTMVATFELLHRAAAAKRNLIIVHEPTYYSNLDDPKDVSSDPMFRLKRDFVAANNLSVFRFHDHWHGRKPDGIIDGMAVGLGWKKYQNPDNARLFVLPETTLNALAIQIRDQLKIRAIRVVGDPHVKVSRAAFNPGSTGLNLVMRYFSGDDVDVFVCGEPREWDAVEYARDSIAAGKKKGLIVLGHDMSEERGMEECARWLTGFIPEVPVEFMPSGEAFWSPTVS
jgi:putative NIF3 family GTP cyclohydrolase 1 type 2